MKHNRTSRGARAPLSLAKPARRLLAVGLPPIYAVLFLMLYRITDRAPFCEARATYYGRMLEYPVAALMLLTAGTVLIDCVCKRLHTASGK